MIWGDMVAGLVGALGYFGVLLIVLRVSRREPAVLVFLVAACVYVVALAASALLRLTNFWVFSVAYWWAILCFLMAFGAIYKSLSLRILLHLAAAPGMTISVETLRQTYIFGTSFSDRLNLIVARGYATQAPDGLQLTAQGRSIATRTRALQRFFGIERSG